MFGQFVHRYLPFLLFALPVVAVNSAYLVSSITNHVPDCITYLTGCASISSTARVMPQKGIFLAGLVPTAVLTVLFWTHAESWLTGNGKHGVTANRSLLVIGTIASFFLLVYVTTLGIPGKYYTLTRKFAVLIYFGFTFIAQLLLIKRLLLADRVRRSCRRAVRVDPRQIRYRQNFAVSGPLVRSPVPSAPSRSHWHRCVHVRWTPTLRCSRPLPGLR